MKSFFILFLWFPFIAWGQVTDHFSDGNFSQNPPWNGTVQLFIVNSNFQLQLNDTASGTAWLSTENHQINNTEWRFWVRFSFSPSSNNNGRIYLVADTDALDSVVNGYFLQIGESGSSDALELFRQNGDVLTSVCRGTEGLIASSFTLGIKITRDSTGNWQLFADPSGGENYQPEAAGFDNQVTTTRYLGFFCKYTKSNSTKMYFDNVYAGPIVHDNEPPKVENVYPLADSSLLVTFDEIVEKTSAENPTNYVLNPAENPTMAVLQSDGKTVILTFAQPFSSGIQYTVSIAGINDLAGNTMLSADFSFSYYIPVAHDVVFNEIMADPSPPVLLPEVEFLELFNRTNQVINLTGWKLVIGTSEKVFDQASIDSAGYLILSKSTAEPDLSGYGPFYGFSSFSLKNTGQILKLYDASDHLITRLTYSDNWYGNPDKKEGGWSLEQINPDNICSQRENWTASIDNNGGTPGKRNSVYAKTELYPQVKQLEIVADNILRLWFTQSMDTSSIGKPSVYDADNGLGHPQYVYTFNDTPNKVELYFENAFLLGKTYRLTLSQTIKNCIGLSMPKDTTLIFGIPDTAQVNDIIINEILFNPLGNGVDYVEVYNRSEKIIDLSQLLLGSIKNSPPAPPDTTYDEIVGTQSIFPPAEYRLLTTSPQKVMEQYKTDNPAAFVQMASFPSYPNDKGTVFIATRSGKIIDLFDYSEKMHYPLLNYFDGVSLERIHFDAPTNDKNNWHSAAESVGFGTPGYQNSQFVATDSSTTEITIDPEIFSPDEDGYHDVVNIHYRFVNPGYSLTVFIFSRTGHLVRKLAENRYIGTTEGTLSWDGLQDDNTKAPVGIYVLYLRVFDLNGKIRAYKKTVVLATRM